MTNLLALHPADRVADFRARGWWTDETVQGLLDAQVAARADRLALVDPANKADLTGGPPRRLTWGELDDEVTALAARFLDLGLGPGDLLGVQLPNSVELVEVYLAAWRIGVVVSPLPVQYREHEVRDLAEQARFRVFVSCARLGDRSPAAELAGYADALPGLVHLVALGDPAAAPAALPDRVEVVPTGPASDADRAAVAAHVAEHPADPNACLTVCWTSGTESRPKGVPRCAHDWLAICWATVDAPRMTADDVLLNPFPMINMAGINGMFLPWLRTGAVLVQHHPFDVPVFLGQIAAEGVTYTVAPPALLTVLLQDEALLSRVDLSTLTRIGSGSTPLSPTMVRGWADRGIAIINFFGSNEGVALLSDPQDVPDPEQRARYFPRFGAPGVTWTTRVADWVGVRLVDPVTGAEVTEPGTPGELRLSGPTVFAGYLDGDGRPSPFDETGALRTGDVFEVAGDRREFLRYVDRAKDLVIRGGMNIAPAELEGLIGAHPAVADVAVVGYPDDVLGERVAAVVVPRAGATLTLEELVDFLRQQRIASYKLPERLELRTELPRNPVGKVLKRELRAQQAAS
ncbi:class I adenylate-forming enzyme family protein [Klenkia brasiliensis]|uniref:Acyl-CoA synthetase (AMP-forming)/AMP-acid ligase II n=1 Tax=Klenkia brasiliensis TaxID=333142 RepID=A0A1G8A544_9ACTN|nr:class I adenylate-forming enzyme family protein [Klenkia brasiliensis]SDH15520.1 Acyl-CoA synthetase (AMP-forming)/AMP-acid ligase II [Klenkia brasiliensis]